MSHATFAAYVSLTVAAGWVAVRAAIRTVRLRRWQNRDARASWWEVL